MVGSRQQKTRRWAGFVVFAISPRHRDLRRRLAATLQARLRPVLSGKWRLCGAGHSYEPMMTAKAQFTARCRSSSTHRAILILVDQDGFEPSRLLEADLQSAGINHSPTDPETELCHKSKTMCVVFNQRVVGRSISQPSSWRIRSGVGGGVCAWRRSFIHARTCSLFGCVVAMMRS